MILAFHLNSSDVRINRVSSRNVEKFFTAVVLFSLSRPRYLTMLFYLSSVDEGGETTFPVADNRTYDEQVSDSISSIHGTRHQWK